MIDDVQAIKNLIYSYAELLDSGDVEGFARLFAHGTLRTHGVPDEYRGEEAVRRMIRRVVALYDGIPGTKHAITNVVVEVDGSRAAARSYFTVLQARPELPLQPILAGRYQDRFERVDGAWRYADHLVYLDLVGDVRHHVKAPEGPPTRGASPRGSARPS